MGQEVRGVKRYKVEFVDGFMWIVIDKKPMRNLAIFHQECPDAEKMARSLCDWLNSGPDAKM